MTAETEALLNLKDWHMNFKGYIYNFNEISGIYLLAFPNQKFYIGSSKNLGKRLSTHLNCLNSFAPPHGWYLQAQKENCFPAQKAGPKPIDPKDRFDKKGHRIGERASKASIEEYEKELSDWWKIAVNWWELPRLGYLKVHICPCSDYGEFEDRVLRGIRDQDMWYNTQFYGNNIKKERK